jgi:hypothetical protein
MKRLLFEMPSNGKTRDLGRVLSRFGMAVAQAAWIGMAAAGTIGYAEESAIEKQGVQAFTLGRVDEVLADIVTDNPEVQSRNHEWPPGSLASQQVRSAWKPGYVFLDGYLGSSFDRHGALDAPVYFLSSYDSRLGYSYSPVVAIELVALMEHLFPRIHDHHNEFGDDCDRSYRDRGYHFPNAYHPGRRGDDRVDPYRRWKHREDRDWERRHEVSYDDRRDHSSARPSRTWAVQKKRRMDRAEAREQQFLIASRLDQMAKLKDRAMRTERIPAEERRKITNRSCEARKTREQRRRLEKESVSIASGKPEWRADKPPRPEPQAKEPKREPRELSRQPARTEKAKEPSSRQKSGTDAEVSEQSRGQGRKMERN